jgi:hypothetical protein
VTAEASIPLLSVSPEGVCQRLALELRDEVGPVLAHDPAGFKFGLYRRQGRKMHCVGSVIVSQSDWPGEPGEWLHASIAREDRMPSYADLAALHKAVFGARYAYQVFAPPAAHVNIHPRALHLWGRVDDGDGRILPAFGATGTI